MLQCSAAPSPPARPRSAARHCGNADGSPARAGPNRSGHPLPTRAAPCPGRSGLPLSPASLAPFRFPPAPARHRGTFPPAAGCSRLVSPRSPARLVFGDREGPHPAPGAERRRTPPAATLVAPSSTPASLCGSPRRRDFEAPGAPPTRGGSLVSALLRSSFPGRISSLPILRASHRLCFPVSFSLSPLTPLRSPAQTGWTLRSPRRGGGPTSASLPRGCHQALGIAAPGTGEPPLSPRGARVR